jgi:aminoglycoside 2'-N-acetyltransferase I
VVEAATKYIAAAGADIGLATCDPALGAFYAQADWIPLANTTLLFGDVTSPVAVDELVLMLFVSEKGKRARQSFEGRQVYVGANTW